MHIPDSVIERVLSGRGTEEEKRQVAVFFKDSPGKVAQYLTEDSWDAFEAPGEQAIPTEKMRAYIESQVGKPPVRMLRYGWAAAACVLLLAGLAALLLWATDKQNAVQRPPMACVRLPADSGKNAAPLRVIHNPSSTPGRYSLPDGSVVRLGAHSTLSFYSPFIHGRRDISLTGEAVFTVAKDAAMPFSVHSKGLVTTALGTVFGVDDNNGQYAVVRLYSGRIVVKQEGAAGGNAFADAYLTPGQELLLNKMDFSVRVKASEALAMKTNTPAGRLKPMTFTKQPLAEVFRLLQQEYGVRISYDTADVRNMDFSGVFNRNKETLESFLHMICELNELKCTTADGNRYSIQVK